MSDPLSERYHYRECGLPNVYLENGYREVQTPYGRGVAIEDVHGLHQAIARDLVQGKPALTGIEVRFIRKFLDLTQGKLGEFLGVEDQTVRNWESVGAESVPKHADRGIRLVFRDLTRRPSPPLPALLENIETAKEWRAVPYRYEADAREHWSPEREAA